MNRPSRNRLKKNGRKREDGDHRRAEKNDVPSQVLIVDSDTEYVETLIESYRIVSIQTGRVAIERVRRRNDIDLAVIEYRLADMSGIEVMKEIKDLNPSILVIIVTAYGDEDVAVEAFRSGARDYLKKPFSISELSAKIDFYLALRHADKKRRKNILPSSRTTMLPGRRSSVVTLSQYHRIQQAVRFINDNYRTDIRLAAVAGAASMSLAHFSRIFRKVMGLSYQAYLNSRRITKAKNLLQSSPLKITEIAVSLGFADPTGFGRIFKKLTGQTASAYRNSPRK